MLVYRYDKTFEGLLTAVFDAFFRRMFPEALIVEGEPEPMFTTEVHRVVTDKQKADRVWKGLEKKLPKNICNLLMHVWLSEKQGSDHLLFRYIRKVFESDVLIVTNFADDDMLEAKKIAQQVSKERHYLIQFVRFQKAGDDTFFAPVSPSCNALPLVIKHFKDRFADQKWLIYDIKRKYGYYYDLKTVQEITLLDTDNFEGGKLDEKLMSEDEKLFQDLWKGYFKALTIRERLNLKLQRQHMPKRFWKYLTEKQ